MSSVSTSILPRKRSCCCDEKTQCQALERSQPGLPLGIGHIRTRTHDYKRHGTITLFAALNYLDGKLISRTEQRHTHVEWLRFLKQIERETPSRWPFTSLSTTTVLISMNVSAVGSTVIHASTTTSRRPGAPG